jgi:general secretion pathway protein N
VKRISVWIALGLGAYLVFVLATLPASFLLARLERADIHAVAASGSVWHGRAVGLKWKAMPLGDLEWHVRPASLLLGRLAAHAELARADGYARGDLAVGLTGTLTVGSATLALPLDALTIAGAPPGWRGKLAADISNLTLRNGWIEEASATLEARELVGPARNPAAMGGFRVAIPGQSGRASADERALHGDLSDLGDGPLAVQGTVRVDPDGSYLIEGTVAPRPSAPSRVVDTLRYLGEPDTEGRRPFSISGTL